MPTPSENLARSFEKVFRPDALPRLAVACSGGSDSLALLLLCKAWREQGVRRAGEDYGDSLVGNPVDSVVTALICDHRQRASSTRECEALRLRLERDFGLAAFVFAPQMPLSSYKGNLQQNMRLFRLRKFLEWCFENEVSYLALGHTRDDQIETHLLQEAGLLRGRGGMRAKRSAGICGQGQEQKKEVFLLRPLLSTSKASLQAWLRDGGIGWLEDPSNASPCYARNRIRPVCARLSQAEQSRLLISCATLREEEEKLEEAVRSFMRVHATWHAEGYIRIESRAFLALDEKVALKVLASVARSVGGKGVRRRQVERVGGAWHRCLEIFLHNSKNAEIDKRIDKKESAVL